MVTKIVKGTAGDDVLNSAGFPNLTRFIVTTGNDVINGSSVDTIVGGRLPASVLGGQGLWIRLSASAPNQAFIRELSAPAGQNKVNTKPLGMTDAIGTDFADVMEGGTGDNYFRGGGGDDVLRGGFGNDTLREGTGNDVLRGGFGDDILAGGKGRDKMFGGEGSDILSGGGGRDRLYGGNGNDFMNGGSGADYLNGGDGADALTGGRGNDRLDGGNGWDRLTGGAGADTFIFTTAGHTTSDEDIITDFDPTVDKVRLKGVADATQITIGQTISGDTTISFTDDAGNQQYILMFGVVLTDADINASFIFG